MVSMTDDSEREPITQRGLYLMADTPVMAHALLLEDGSGDRELLAEVLRDELSDDELGDLLVELAEESCLRCENYASEVGDGS